MANAAQLPKPSLTRQYVVIWRQNDVYLVKGFTEYSEAESVYHNIISILRADKIEDPEVYFLMLLAVYNGH